MTVLPQNALEEERLSTGESNPFLSSINKDSSTMNECGSEPNFHEINQKVIVAASNSFRQSMLEAVVEMNAMTEQQHARFALRIQQISDAYSMATSNWML